MPVIAYLNEPPYFRLDPDFVNIDLVHVDRISFGQPLPYEFYYRTPTLGAKESRVTDQPERKTSMNRLFRKFVRATSAQDLLEYALLAGFVAVASVAVMPDVASSISTIFSKLDSVMIVASTQGN